MIHLLIPILGLALAVTGWSLPRLIAGARMRASAAMLLDLLVPALIFSWLCAVTARPLFSGVIVLALGGGYAYADRSKRKVLAEPIVFTDIFQALDIFRHPKLALPFPHPGRVVAGIALALAFFIFLFLCEPAAWTWSVSLPVILTAWLAAVIWLAVEPGRSALGRALRRFRPTSDPARDGEEYGSLATLLIHGIIARGERATRRLSPGHVKATPVHLPAAAGAPIVLVQCESFFDARRLHPEIAASVRLPNFDRLCANGVQWGRLAVPSWGANTVRTEFEVLTGLSQSEIGMDWFDPYHRFADAPVASLAWRLREAGYRTICLHPFDRTFYRRDRVMKQLGFDVFLGDEAFVGAQRRNGNVADIEVARMVSTLLREEGARTFIFAITMENHAPWVDGAAAPNLLPTLKLPGAEHRAFAQYLHGLQSSDEMLGLLSDTLAGYGEDALLAFYGDHLPGFPSSFSHFKFTERSSDYLIWQSSQRVGRRVELPAHRLGGEILRASAAVLPRASKSEGLRQATH